MNGIHDMGGMHGMGPVNPETGEPIFKAPWERRMFAVLMATFTSGVYNVHEFRHTMERMAPADYLNASYFEKWLYTLEGLLIEKGEIERTELEAAWGAVK
jgi:nitrile hydratase